MSHYFYDLTHFKRLRQKYINIFIRFFGSNEYIQKSFWNQLTFRILLWLTSFVNFSCKKLSFLSRLSHVIQFTTQELKVYGDHLARQMKFVLSHDWLLYIQLVVVNSRQTVSFCSTNSLLALTAAVIWCSAIPGTTALLIVAVLGGPSIYYVCIFSGILPPSLHLSKKCPLKSLINW